MSLLTSNPYQGISDMSLTPNPYQGISDMSASLAGAAVAQGAAAFDPNQAGGTSSNPHRSPLTFHPTPNQAGGASNPHPSPSP